MVNFTFGGEATTLYNRILGWNKLPGARTMIYGVVPATHISLVDINKRTNVSYPREFDKVGGRIRSFVNKGEANPVPPEHRNVPAIYVTAEPQILESVNTNNDEYNTMDFDELTHKPYSDGVAQYINFLETQARSVMPLIDVKYFSTFTEEQLVNNVPTTGFNDDVTEHIIATDLATGSEATANALVAEFMSRITAIQERAPGNSLDNFVIHVPFSVITYLRAHFKRAVVRSYHPNDPMHPGQNYNPAAALDLDGVLCVAYENSTLGNSTTPEGEYGYINNREAIKTDYESRNDPMFAVHNMMNPNFTFLDGIMAEMNAKGMQYDQHSRDLLADLQANKGFHQPGVMIPGNIFRSVLYHLGSDIDNFGSRVDVVERATRLMPKGMERLIFETAKLPTFSQTQSNESKAAEQEIKLQKEVLSLQERIAELERMIKSTVAVKEENPVAAKTLKIQEKEKKRLDELK